MAVTASEEARNILKASTKASLVFDPQKTELCLISSKLCFRTQPPSVTRWGVREPEPSSGRSAGDHCGEIGACGSAEDGRLYQSHFDSLAW